MKKRILLGVVLSTFLHLSFSQIINWDTGMDAMSLGKQLRFYEDKEGTLNINAISSGQYQALFQKSEQNILNFGFNESVYWLKFDFNNTDEEPLIIEVAHASLPVCDLYYSNGTEDWNVIKAGYEINLHNKQVNNHLQIFPLPTGQMQCYIKVVSNSHPLPIKIWKEKKYEVEANKQKLVYGFYIGFMAFVVITNLFFFFTHRNKLYLYYAIVVILYAGYAAMVLDGFVLYMFPKLDMMFWYITIPTLGMTVQTAYCLAFLEAKKYVPKVFVVVRIIVIYFGLYFFIKYLLPLPTILAINTIHALLSFFIMGYVGLKVGNKGNKLGYYFALAYFIYFLLVLTEAIYIQTGSPKYLFGLSHVAVATLIEAFVLSYLLSKRSEWEKKENELAKLHAQEELVNTIRENEKIVRQQNVILEKKVLQRTASIKTVNERLKVAIATKDKFFSIIAHDLKSPFNSLLGLSDILLQDYDGFSEKRKKEFLTEINKGLNNAHDLLSNLLIWSQSQRDDISLHPEEIELRPYVVEIYSHLKQQADRKNITLKINIDEKLKVIGDSNMLRTVFLNLMNNAIKFTNKEGNINIDAFEENKEVIISIKDNGLGISPSRQSQLFVIGQNQSTFGTEDEKGTGLGLILCKEFVEKHGGHLKVKSEYGVGSTFSFNLPGYHSK